jgi:hypothetical protein
VKTDRAIITATHAGAVSTRHAAVAAQSKLMEIKTMAYTLKRSINGLTHADIKRIYDQNPNLTLKELSNLTGYAVPFLKFILTCTDEEY